MIAALFVDEKGIYSGRDDIDLWPESRDARNYRGPHPVVAHPPCESWCRLAGFRESRTGRPRRIDGGCFASALQSLFRWGGVLEHPAHSDAWDEYGLIAPKCLAWHQCSDMLGRSYWVTEVWQVDYGHTARKRTWLLYVGANSPTPVRREQREHTTVISNWCKKSRLELKRLGGKATSASPPEFAEELIALARNCGGAP